MATVTAEILAKFNFSKITSVADGVSITIPAAIPSSGTPTQFTSGSTAGKTSEAYFDKRTYAVSTPVTLDLSALAAASTNTGSAAFTKVVGLYFKNHETIDGGSDMTIGAAAGDQFAGFWGGSTNTITIKAGQTLLFYDESLAGVTVDGTHSDLKLDPGADTISFSLGIIGR